MTVDQDSLEQTPQPDASEERETIIAEIGRLAERIEALKLREDEGDFSAGAVLTWVLLVEYESQELIERDGIALHRFSPMHQRYTSTAGLIKLMAETL